MPVLNLCAIPVTIPHRSILIKANNLDTLQESPTRFDRQNVKITRLPKRIEQKASISHSFLSCNYKKSCIQVAPLCLFHTLFPVKQPAWIGVLCQVGRSQVYDESRSTCSSSTITAQVPQQQYDFHPLLLFFCFQPFCFSLFTPCYLSACVRKSQEKYKIQKTTKAKNNKSQINMPLLSFPLFAALPRNTHDSSQTSSQRKREKKTKSRLLSTFPKASKFGKKKGQKRTRHAANKARKRKSRWQKEEKKKSKKTLVGNITQD